MYVTRRVGQRLQVDIRSMTKLQILYDHSLGGTCTEENKGRQAQLRVPEAASKVAEGIQAEESSSLTRACVTAAGHWKNASRTYSGAFVLKRGQE